MNCKQIICEAFDKTKEFCIKHTKAVTVAGVLVGFKIANRIGYTRGYKDSARASNDVINDVLMNKPELIRPFTESCKELVEKR